MKARGAALAEEAWPATGLIWRNCQTRNTTGLVNERRTVGNGSGVVVAELS